jgi:hypothetical protein
VEKPCDLPWFGLGLSPLAGLLLDRGKDPFEVFAGWFTGIDGKAEVVQKTTMVLVFHPSIHPQLSGPASLSVGWRNQTRRCASEARHARGAGPNPDRPIPPLAGLTHVHGPTPAREPSPRGPRRAPPPLPRGRREGGPMRRRQLIGSRRRLVSTTSPPHAGPPPRFPAASCVHS